MKTLGKCALGETGAQPARKGYLSRMQAAKTSTHCDLAQGGPSKHWVKMKNRKHPAMECVKDAFS